MRGLKILVIVQGILIVVGVVALVFVLVHRIGRTGAEIVANAPSRTVPLAGGPRPVAEPVTASAITPPVASAGAIPTNPSFIAAPSIATQPIATPPAALVLPAGGTVLGMVGAGSYVVLRVGTPGGEELLTLDPATGATVKAVAIKTVAVGSSAP